MNPKKEKRKKEFGCFVNYTFVGWNKMFIELRIGFMLFALCNNCHSTCTPSLATRSNYISLHVVSVFSNYNDLSMLSIIINLEFTITQLRLFIFFPTTHSLAPWTISCYTHLLHHFIVISCYTHFFHHFMLPSLLPSLSFSLYSHLLLSI